MVMFVANMRLVVARHGDDTKDTSDVSYVKDGCLGWLETRFQSQKVL